MANETKLSVQFPYDYSTDLQNFSRHDRGTATLTQSVLLSDTIFEFKNKLNNVIAFMTKRKEEELNMAPPAERGALQQQYNQWRNIEITAKHVVLVFYPTDQLRELFKRREDYSKRYEIEIKDPSRWKPLDESRTFNHYVAEHGFGRGAGPQL